MNPNQREPRYISYRIAEFSDIDKKHLKDVAKILSKHRNQILEKWLNTQLEVWHPPGFSYEQLSKLFETMFDHLTISLETGQLENSMEGFGQIGTDLARKEFPYEALIASIHFLEESYLPYLLEPSNTKIIEWLISTDEYLHGVLAEIATCYFKEFKVDLMKKAETGRIIQDALLPDIPEIALDLNIAYVYRSSEELTEIGGDFIDLFLLENNQAAFILGDISGHGLMAAKNAVTLRSLYRGFMREDPNPDKAFFRINNVLTSELAPEGFATAIAAIYNDGVIKLSRAGHPKAIICDDGKCLPSKDDGDTVLGIDKDVSFSLSEIELNKEAVFVAYTDGLSEVRNKSGELFGEERIIEVLNKTCDAKPQAIAENLKDEALRFSNGVVQDDIAILVIKRRS